MFRKTMTFDDLEGKEVKQTFYFNYNKKEVGELLTLGYLVQFPPSDPKSRIPLEAAMDKLTTTMEESGLNQEQNNRQAYAIFHDLILDAYGEKGDDNVTFVKNDRTREYFSNHVAFVELIFEIMGDTKLAGEFFEQCLPAKAVAEAKAEMQKENAGKLTDASLSDMVAEANRRQQDPATRIEPGVIPDDADPAVVALAQAQASQQPGPEPVETKPKPKSEWTPEDITALSDEEFAKLDIQGLSQPAMVRAFQRKTG